MQHLRRRRARLSFLVTLVISVVLLAACGGGGSGPGPTPIDLQRTTWRAILIRNAAPVVGAEPTIQFDGGQAAGTTGCNTYGGAYRVGADGTFEIGAIAMTEMACDGVRGTQEMVVVDILSHADRLEIVDGQLRISGTSGSITFAEDPR